MIVLTTKRLILRTFEDSDLDAMAAINHDPKVMEHFPAVGTREQTREHIEKIQMLQEKYGYSLYAVELKSTAEMIGFVGLMYRTKEVLDVPFMPSTEIGWRLSSNHWNQGYATESAAAVLRYAFDTLGLDEVVSFTVPANGASRRVMEKIGLYHDPKDDFKHPMLPEDSPLSQHVLYRLSKKAFLNQQKPLES